METGGLSFSDTLCACMYPAPPYQCHTHRQGVRKPEPPRLYFEIACYYTKERPATTYHGKCFFCIPQLQGRPQQLLLGYVHDMQSGPSALVPTPVSPCVDAFALTR